MVRTSPHLVGLCAAALISLAASTAQAGEQQRPQAIVDVTNKGVSLVVEVPVETMVGVGKEDAMAEVRALLAMHPRDAWVETERYCSRFLRATEVTMDGAPIRWERVNCPQGDLVLSLARKSVENPDILHGLLRISAHVTTIADPTALTLQLPATVPPIPVSIDGQDRGLVAGGEPVALILVASGS